MKIENFGYNMFNDINGRMSVKQDSVQADLNIMPEAKQDSVQADLNTMPEAKKDNVHSKQEDGASADTRYTGQSESVHNLIFDFKRENDYNLIGASSKLDDLDVEKALSNMQKDSVLSQYRFFVKPQQGLGTDEDGTVRRVIRNFNEE